MLTEGALYLEENMPRCKAKWHMARPGVKTTFYRKNPKDHQKQEWRKSVKR
jgi:hypothetical protein